jgi:hypothetical protein
LGLTALISQEGTFPARGCEGSPDGSEGAFTDGTAQLESKLALGRLERFFPLVKALIFIPSLLALYHRVCGITPSAFAV